MRLRTYKIASVLSFLLLTVLFALFIWGMAVLFNVPTPDCSQTIGTVTEFKVGDSYESYDWKWVEWSYNYTVSNRTYVVNGSRDPVSGDQVDFWKDKYSPVGKRIAVDYKTSDPSVLSDCTLLVAQFSSVILIICATFAYVVFALYFWQRFRIKQEEIETFIL